MTGQDWTPDGDEVRSLQQLVQARVDEHGWSDSQLARRSNGGISKSRWQQLRTGVRMTEFPQPETLGLIAQALGYDETVVILATAKTLGRDVHRSGPRLAHLLPAGTDRLSEKMQSVILALIRAAVAETPTGTEDGLDGLGGRGGNGDLTMQWTKQDSPDTGNALVRRTDTPDR